MPKRNVEADIELLGAQTAEGPSPESLAAVRHALTDRVGLVAAKAAKIAAGLPRLRDTVPDLLTAFSRQFEKPLERDPQCWAKHAIAQALVALGCRDSAPYLRGARWVQMEPVWGGRADTASVLRGTCLLALAAGTDAPRDEVLRCLVDGLSDPAQTVRLESARALAEMGGTEPSLLLRLKARLGDKEPPVIGQVFEALLHLEGPPGVPFIADFLETAAPEVQAEAALALGSSRLPEAVDALEKAWDAARAPDLREALARALGASRQPRAFEFLLALLRRARAAEAVEEAGTAVEERFRTM